MIRRANENDIEMINPLLYQVAEIHHKGRPDLFNGGAKKYTDSELKEILADESRPIFVNADDSGRINGLVSCIVKQIGGGSRTDTKLLHINDFCVDESARRKGVGKALNQYVLDYAKQLGCHNITLDAWTFNDGAVKFYEACGYSLRSLQMEIVLDK